MARFAFIALVFFALLANPGTWQLEASGRGVRGAQQTLELDEDGATWSVRAGGSAAYAWGHVLAGFGFGALGLSGRDVEAQGSAW